MTLEQRVQQLMLGIGIAILARQSLADAPWLQGACLRRARQWHGRGKTPVAVATATTATDDIEGYSKLAVAFWICGDA